MKVGFQKTLLDVLSEVSRVTVKWNQEAGSWERDWQAQEGNTVVMDMHLFARWLPDIRHLSTYLTNSLRDPSLCLCYSEIWGYRFGKNGTFFMKFMLTEQRDNQLQSNKVHTIIKDIISIRNTFVENQRILYNLYIYKPNMRSVP